MELDCTISANVVFDKVIEYDQIRCLIGEVKQVLLLDKYGRQQQYCCPKCVIFPKGKTTWDGFQRPFKDGDIVATESGAWIGIIRDKSYRGCFTYAALDVDDGGFYTNGTLMFERFATEEEKVKLFEAIKANGYRWNAETKTLEKLIEPKFKVGDKIKYKNGRYKNGVKEGIILSITDDTYDVAVTNDMGIFIPIADEYNWELVPDKFDITTLKPYDKVLYRMHDKDTWCNSFYSFYKSHHHFITSLTIVRQCIPYEKNEHLLGTTNDCDDYYKTWK